MRAAAGAASWDHHSPRMGRRGLDYVSYALAIEAIAKASATVAVSLSVTNSLVAELLAHAGRAPQKEQWLRRLATGDAIGAFALSEPDAGTDAANQQTRAAKSGAGYRISGRKVWVANAEAAAVAIVFACTRPGLRGQGVTAFLVPMDTPGITRTARADSLGVRGLGCTDLRSSISWSATTGPGSPVDQGFGLAMWALQGGRVAIASQALGIGAAALDEAIAYAKQRQAFAATRSATTRRDSVDAGPTRRTGARSGAPADPQGRGREGSPGTHHGRGIDGEMSASEAAHKAADKAMQILASAVTAGVGRRAVGSRDDAPPDPRDVGSAADDHRRRPPRER